MRKGQTLAVVTGRIFYIITHHMNTSVFQPQKGILMFKCLLTVIIPIVFKALDQPFPNKVNLAMANSF